MSEAFSAFRNGALIHLGLIGTTLACPSYPTTYSVSRLSKDVPIVEADSLLIEGGYGDFDRLLTFDRFDFGDFEAWRIEEHVAFGDGMRLVNRWNVGLADASAGPSLMSFDGDTLRVSNGFETVAINAHPANYNRDLAFDSQDIRDFSFDYQDRCERADLNRDGKVDQKDVDIWLALIGE